MNMYKLWINLTRLFTPDIQKHPDFPKKPLTPYFRFFMEKRAKYAKLHPEMSNLDLTKILSKKYRELPDKKKVSQLKEVQLKDIWFLKLFISNSNLFTTTEKICWRLLKRQRNICAQHDEVQVRSLITIIHYYVLLRLDFRMIIVLNCCVNEENNTRTWWRAWPRKGQMYQRSPRHPNSCGTTMRRRPSSRHAQM